MESNNIETQVYTATVNATANANATDSNLVSEMMEMYTDSHLYFHSKEEKCVYNEFGQCVKSYRYFCPHCNFGIGGMFSDCLNKNCVVSDDDKMDFIVDSNLDTDLDLNNDLGLDNDSLFDFVKKYENLKKIIQFE